MKKIIILILALSLCLSLGACGSSAPSAAPAETPAAVETEAVQETEAPAEVFPAEYEPFREALDALAGEDYEGALAQIEAMRPEPEPLPVEEVTITKENFFDYFEYIDIPDIYLSGTHRDSSGKITMILVLSGFYLKPGYAVAEERLDDCHVGIELKYHSLYFIGNQGIEVDLENRSYTITDPPKEYSLKRDMLAGRYFHYAENEPAMYGLTFPSTPVLSDGKKQFTTINDPESFELLSAEGTLYLTVLPADDGGDAAPQKTVEDLPAAYEPFRDVLEALVNDDFDGAQALIEERMPEPEPIPSVEVTVTKENFLDYFEYVDIPELYIQKGTERDAKGNITRVVVLSGFYLKPEYTPAEDKLGDCYVNVGIKWRLLAFKNNKGIQVDLENRSYTVTGKESFHRDYDDMINAWLLSYPDEAPRYGMIFSAATILSDGKTQETMIKDPDSFEIVSVEGRLFLCE